MKRRKFTMKIFIIGLLQIILVLPSSPIFASDGSNVTVEKGKNKSSTNVDTKKSTDSPKIKYDCRNIGLGNWYSEKGAKITFRKKEGEMSYKNMEKSQKTIVEFDWESTRDSISMIYKDLKIIGLKDGKIKKEIHPSPDNIRCKYDGKILTIATQKYTRKRSF